MHTLMLLHIAAMEEWIIDVDTQSIRFDRVVLIVLNYFAAT